MAKLVNYESMLVLKPNLSKEETEKLLEKFEKTIKDQGGDIQKIDRMGKRRMAYEMKKLAEGFYCLIQFAAPGTAIQELERQFRLEDDLVQDQTVRAPEEDRKVSA